MKNPAIAAFLIFCSVHALACPLSETVAERYGISFSGFKTAIPAAGAPDTNDGTFVRVTVRDDSKVSDGFRHAIVMNARTRKAWVLRTGGFAGVYEWFGPVDATGASLEHCILEPMPVVTLALRKR
ncbi:MAG TPA: hypothetical protein VF774_08220 [Pseudoduganella sp.]|jgi:hypothetical protein